MDYPVEEHKSLSQSLNLVCSCGAFTRTRNILRRCLTLPHLSILLKGQQVRSESGSTLVGTVALDKCKEKQERLNRERCRIASNRNQSKFWGELVFLNSTFLQSNNASVNPWAFIQKMRRGLEGQFWFDRLVNFSDQHLAEPSRLHHQMWKQVSSYSALSLVCKTSQEWFSNSQV